MKIIARIATVVREYRHTTGEWPNTVNVGHQELRELSAHYGYAPTTMTFVAEDHGEVSLYVRLADTPKELQCSING